MKNIYCILLFTAFILNACYDDKGNYNYKDINEIETCLDALYGIMMLRLQKKAISPETEKAIKEITTLVGLLSDYYIKDNTEGLKFEDD